MDELLSILMNEKIPLNCRHLVERRSSWAPTKRGGSNESGPKDGQTEDFYQNGMSDTNRLLLLLN
jgi:hypothetical protein